MNRFDLIMPALTFLPAVGALALLVLRSDDLKFIRAMALVVATAEFLFSLVLTVHLEGPSSEPQPAPWPQPVL